MSLTRIKGKLSVRLVPLGLGCWWKKIIIRDFEVGKIKY